jgi:plasmid stability protein
VPVHDSRFDATIMCSRILCYCETVKNITVSLPDDVYRNARVAAAQHDTSVSALVVAYLERLSGRMEEFGRLEALQHQVQAEIGQFRATGRLSRDEVHDRAVR